MSPLERFDAIRDLRCSHEGPGHGPREPGCVQGALKSVLFVVASRLGADGTCWPAVETIAADAGLRETAARAALHRLEELGLLAVTRRLGHRPNLYQLNEDALAQLTSPSEPRPAKGSLNEGQRFVKRGSEVRLTRVMGSFNEPQLAHEPAHEPAQGNESARDPLCGSPDSQGHPELKRKASSAELHRLGEIYGETVRQRLGTPFGLPRGAASDLAIIADDLAPAGTVEARLEWFAETVGKFVDATKHNPIANQGFRPSRLLDWLNAGAPKNWGRSAPALRIAPKSDDLPDAELERWARDARARAGETA